MTRSFRLPSVIGGVVSSALLLGLPLADLGGLVGQQAGNAWAATIPPALLALRPIKGVAYQPSPSDDCQLQTPNCQTPNAVYFDSDFYNTDFPALWGPGASATGRDDLKTFKAAGINFLHVYNWNPQRSHTTFLDAAVAHGMKVTIPVTNYTACVIVGGCQGVTTASYQTAYNVIQSTFNEIYVSPSKSPHPAAAVWAIFNEYDINSIDPQLIVFVIQAILQLEETAKIPVANRLPIVVPVSNAVHNQAAGNQPAYFQNAEAIYRKANPTATDATIPPGVISIIALSMALQNTAANGPTSYQAANDSAAVTVAAVPPDFWLNRFIATVNPFTAGPTLNQYITNAGQFQSAFPNQTITSGSVVWNSTWNSLPPLFFTEMGINIAGSGGTTATQAAFVLSQLQCTNPWAANATLTTNGYFLGSNIFEFEYEYVNGHWGMFTFASSPAPVQHLTTSGQTYLVDTMTAQLAWASVQSGFATTTVTSCP